MNGNGDEGSQSSYNPKDPATWARPSVQLEERNLLWEQYKTYADIFKFYVDATLKVTTWFYAITGAILVYYFDHVGENSYLKWSLLLPAALSLGLGIIFFHGASQAKDMQQKLDYIRDNLRLPGRLHVEVLLYFLIMGGCLYLVVSAVLAGFIITAPGSSIKLQNRVKVEGTVEVRPSTSSGMTRP